MIGFAAMLLLIGMRILCMVSPKSLTREDKRDDPEAVEQIRKAEPVLIAFARGAGLLALKYTLF